MTVTRSLSEHSKGWGCAAQEVMPMLLFVQRAKQLLDHATSLLCRTSRTAPFTIAHEIFNLLRNHKQSPHSSTTKNISLLTEELRYSISEDIVAKQLVGDRIDFILTVLSDENHINDQLEAAQLLINRLAQKKYFDLSAQQITEIILEGGRKKEKLLDLTEGYIAGILDAGYPSQTVFHLLNVSFLDRARDKMSAQERLNRFFSNFDLVQHRYQVNFAISNVAGGISNSFSSVRGKYIEINSTEAKEFLNELPYMARKFFLRNSIAAIVRFDDIPAFDPQSARLQSERALRLLDDLLKFSVHRQRFSICDQAIVWRRDKKETEPVQSGRPRPAMLRGPHESAESGERTLSQFASIFGGSHTGSVNRFVRALELHSTALSTAEEESQLLNIWIAFETLFVQRGDGPKLQEVLTAIEPYVASCWFGYLFAEMWDEIELKYKALWTDSFSTSEEIKKYSEHYALAAAVCVKMFEPEMTKFLAGLDEDPLLRQRIFNCIKWGQNAKTVRAHWDSIGLRIKYDVNRIYRTRNQIVHTGKSIKGLSEVVQTAHHYFDIVLSVLSLMLGRPGGPKSIEQCNMEALIQRKNYLNYLSDAVQVSAPCTLDNFVRIIFGRNLLAD